MISRLKEHCRKAGGKKQLANREKYEILNSEYAMADALTYAQLLWLPTQNQTSQDSSIDGPTLGREAISNWRLMNQSHSALRTWMLKELRGNWEGGGGAWIENICVKILKKSIFTKQMTFLVWKLLFIPFWNVWDGLMYPSWPTTHHLLTSTPNCYHYKGAIPRLVYMVLRSEPQVCTYQVKK